MAVLWEMHAGDTSRFAIRLAFGPDPHDGRGADRDLSPSWGSFQLWADGRNLCAHIEEGERLDSVHWYLLSLIEWFADNWNPLLHEERLPVRNSGASAWESLRSTRFPPPAIEADEARADKWYSHWQSWWCRHALRSASEGGLLPDVVFRRFRDSVEISWGDTRSAGMPAEFDFLEHAGSVRLSPQEVAVPLHHVLSEAVSYLVSVNGESERLDTLSHTLHLRSLAAQRRERLAWLAGLGTDLKTVKQRFADATRWLADVRATQLLEDEQAAPLVVVGSCQASLMFGCVALDVRREDVLELAGIMVARHPGQFHPPSLGGAVPITQSDDQPWSQGYGLAEDFIAEFGLSRFLATGRHVDVERLLEILGVDIVEASLTDESVRGVAVAGPQYRPCVAVNQNCQWNADIKGRRFTLAHELCHILFDWEVGRPLAMASGPWAPVDIERRANAFAAMLLMPTALVQEAIANVVEPVDTPDGIRKVADDLQTGFEATLRHMTNLGFIDEYDRRRIDIANRRW